MWILCTGAFSGKLYLQNRGLMDLEPEHLVSFSDGLLVFAIIFTTGFTVPGRYKMLSWIPRVAIAPGLPGYCTRYPVSNTNMELIWLPYFPHPLTWKDPINTRVFIRTEMKLALEQRLEFKAQSNGSLKLFTVCLWRDIIPSHNNVNFRKPDVLNI